MCRFALYLGPPIRLSQLVTEPANSMIHQSFHSHERAEPLNGDGFGVAWYVPGIRPEPALFRSISPAWNNQNLLHLAPVTISHCLLAHVRAATPGLPVTQLNCHPFVRGRYAFMHNGTVAGFRGVMRSLRERLSAEAYLAIQGSTDSEHVFALMMDAYRGLEDESPGAMARAMVDTIYAVDEMTRAAGVTEPSLLNLAVTDGHWAVVSRYITDGSEAANSLYVGSGNLVVDEAGVGFLAPCGEGEGEGAVVVASEPLGDGPHWKRVPANHLVMVEQGGTVEVGPLVR